MSIIGTNIKNTREKKSISTKELSKKAGISEVYLKEIESGKRIPNTSLINTLTKILNVNIDALEPSYFSSYFEEEKEPQISQIEQTPKKQQSKSAPIISNTMSDALSKVVRKIPVVNTISSKTNTIEQKDIIDYKIEPIFQNKNTNTSTNELIYFVCTDNSMSGSRILKNDLCLIFLTQSILDKDIVLIKYNNKVFLRRIKYIEQQMVILYPDNPEYETIIVNTNDIVVFGKAIRIEIKI